MKTFTTETTNGKWTHGFASNGIIEPSEIADKLFGYDIPGSWLCCYMIRRFGWPNIGSDDYKNLCSWQLTTPMPGLYLNVTPYLGSRGDRLPTEKFSTTNMHFAVLFDEPIAKEINREPGREAFWARADAAIVKWWKAVGVKLYTFGECDLGDTEETLVDAFSTNTKTRWGLWKRRKEHGRKRESDWLEQASMAKWWLREFVQNTHPEVKLPKMNKRESERTKTRTQIKIESALRAAMKDLLRPTNVRDIYFTPFGDIERCEVAKSLYGKQEAVQWHVDAGRPVVTQPQPPEPTHERE